MKRDWFNPNLIAPIDGYRYYVRAFMYEWFPQVMNWNEAENFFYDATGTIKFFPYMVSRCSEQA